jgi:NADPH:quinone reductase-like Zn-dependent oxidoreductase
VRNVDLVLDTIGGETLEKSWSVLRASGRIASLVEFGIQPRDGLMGEFVFFAGATPFLTNAIQLFLAGQLQIIIDSIVPLDEARSALEKLGTGHARGKILIRVSS